jgi:intracellular sulfur oxidation DsrE/DsrF family protein
MFRLEEVKTHRRGFLGTMAAAAAAGLASLTPLRAEAKAAPHRDSLGSAAADPAFEAWLNRITGRHKMVFDAPEVNGGMPVVWPRVWLNTTNDNYGTTDAQNTGVVILRHASIPLAMVDALWAKYKLGEVFSLKDGDLPATHNTFAKPLPLPLPGTGVEQLLAKGVLFGVCNVALTIYSGAVAQKMGMDAAAVKAEWVAGLIPGCQVVPSGVLAVSRTQEKGCGYCFAG